MNTTKTVEELYFEIKTEWDSVNTIADELNEEIIFWKNHDPKSEYISVFEKRLQETVLARANLGLAIVGLKKDYKKK